MSKKNNIFRITLSIFSGVSFLLLVLGLHFDSMEYFYLSIFIGGPFLFALLIGDKTRSDLLVIFSLAAFVSAWLAPLGFFWERDKYTYSGQSAVKDFDFSAVQFIINYIPIFLGYLLILLIAVFLNSKQKNQSNLIGLNISPAISFLASKTFGSLKIKSYRPRIYLFLTIATFTVVNWWMFNNSIGITGINPPQLPFKLSGILFYMARFVFPIIIIFLLSSFKPTWFDLSLIVAYACYASLTSVSKATLILIFLPLLIMGFLSKRYIFLGFALLIFAVFYPVVSDARNYVYLVEGGISVRNIDFSLAKIIIESLSDYTSGNFFSGPLAIIERIGGGQDVALAAQYDNSLIRGGVVEFIRLYIFDFWNVASDAQEQMYAYKPEVIGHATGDGGFFAHMRLAGGDSILMWAVVTTYLGLFLAVANSTYWRLVRCGVSREFILLYAIFFCILFFAFSIPLWLNVFVIASAIFCRTRIFRSLATRYLSGQYKAGKLLVSNTELVKTKFRE